MSEATRMQFVDSAFDYIPARNTFRRGNKYARLVPGDDVIAVGGDGVFIGNLVVASVHVMTYRAALVAYAGQNHGVIEYADKNDLVFFNTQSRLQMILEDCYGEIDMDEPMTVIFFEDDFVTETA